MDTAPNTFSATAGSPLDARVDMQLIDVLHARARAVTFTNIGVAVSAAAFFYFQLESPWVLAWIAVVVVLTALRLVLISHYQGYKSSVEAASRWRRRYVSIVGVSTTLWAVGAFAIFVATDMDPMMSMFITTLFAGMSMSGALAHSSHVPVVHATIFPLLGSLIIAFALKADALHLVLAMLIGIFVAYIVAFARNANRTLSDLFRVRFELQEKKVEAETANIAKSKFLAAASHDLRQPLHALSLFVSALRERIRYPEVRKIVDSITISTQALEKLFAALLDISRLDAGVVQPQIRDFRLREMLERLRNDYAPVAEEKGLKFACLSTDVVVKSDYHLLERILRNYLSNAIRYTFEGEITLRCTPRVQTASIEVVDTGIGIPREQQEEIFREFHQLANPERDRTKGLGLGLAIVDRVAKLLGHAVYVDSDVGRGAVFGLTVPIGDAAAAVEVNTSAAEADGDFSGMLVLVIDDEEAIRNGMNALLGQWGCELLLASCEEEAVALVGRASRTPDVVIADYRLRENKTGVQAIQRVRAACGLPVPAVIIAGDTAPERLREVAASGFQLFHKPVPTSQIRAFLRRAAMPH